MEQRKWSSSSSGGGGGGGGGGGRSGSSSGGGDRSGHRVQNCRRDVRAVLPKSPPTEFSQRAS